MRKKITYEDKIVSDGIVGNNAKFRARDANEIKDVVNNNADILIGKQDKLTAGAGISIDGNIIIATGATEAQQSAIDAENAKNIAIDAKNDSETNANIAVEASNVATEAKNDSEINANIAVDASNVATEAKNETITAKNIAVEAKNLAETSAISASNSALLASQTIWKGTQIEYDGIPDKNPLTLYFILMDNE